MKIKKRKWNKDYLFLQLPLHLMLIVPVVIVFIFSYLPFVGLLMAFQRFSPSLDGFWAALFSSRFVGMDVFRFMFNFPSMGSILFNTVFIAVSKIISVIIFPLIFALMLNEVRTAWFMRSVQTITFMPYFLSWVILGGILIDILAVRGGAVNVIIGWFGIEPVNFLGEPRIFPWVLIISHVWQQIGFNTIIILAAIINIDPGLYEAAAIDGAKRIRQTMHITIPSILPIVMLIAILALGGILRAGQDQVLNLYNPAVYSTGDILDTFVYRVGITQNQFSRATAVGLFQSLVSMVLIIISYKLANKYSGYQVF